MLPFCGYNMAEHFAHWLELGHKLQAGGARLPRVFCVNWFRTDESGKFVWPGFSENMRVLAWMVERIEGSNGGAEHPVGVTPRYEDLNWTGLDFSREQFARVTAVNVDEWKKELDSHADLFRQLAHNLPPQLEATRQKLAQRFN
jgi:phosphoenolpyruvate carboxykinase (GTP)